MKIRILGAGFYGCHLASVLKDEHEVEVHEIQDRIFNGASGNIPARIHQGFHYPRSKKTRNACLKHIPEFMDKYGEFTRAIRTNIYAIADKLSLVDYEQYVDTLRDEVWFEEIHPEDYGLKHVEGAVLTMERHIVCDDIREHFEKELDGLVKYNTPIGFIDDPNFDLTIDATFCANDNAGVDRYEPCVVALLEGNADTAITIMDGPFCSLYPWNQKKGYLSLSSAKWTPFSKTCRTYDEAQDLLESLTPKDIQEQMNSMFQDMAHYYPELKNYKIVKPMLSTRAMPLSGADTRLVDVVRVGEKAIRVRAGKIDAVVNAEHIIREKFL